jgi:hypothetical protein
MENISAADRRMFRKMGYFRDQRGILRRYRREKQNWDTHLEKTRNFAIRSAEKRNKGSAIILGSGWLLDVPVEELSHLFEKITLMDIRHPRAVRKDIRKYGNMELVAGDISGFSHSVYQYVKKYRNRRDRPPISTIKPSENLNLNSYDFVFSCNILNQLDILLIDFLSESFDLKEQEIVDFRKKIQQYHINLLPGNRSCLVADDEEILYSPQGEELSRKISVFHPIVHRSDAERWVWKFDTAMTYYPDKITHFRVLAVEL